MPLDKFRKGEFSKKASDINTTGIVGVPFSKSCPCFDFEFKFTDARFRTTPGNRFRPPTAQLIFQMQIKVTENKCKCEYFHIIQFAREVQLTPGRPAHFGDGRRKERSIPDSKTSPQNDAWHLDSTVAPDPNAGTPYIEDTSLATDFEDSVSTFWDIPETTRGRGFEAYTCLTCFRGTTESIVGCLRWGFDAAVKGENLVPTPNPNPFTVACGPPPGDMAGQAVKQWNRIEDEKIHLALP